MKILINRFTLRHDNIDYGVGDILEVEDAIGSKLVAASNGAISRVADREVKVVQPAPTKTPDVDTPEAPEVPEEPMALPEVNPVQAMNKGKGK